MGMGIYTAATTLIIVMDPLGNIPVFLSILKKFDPRTQNKIILRESLIAFIIMVVFLFFGKYIMHGLHVTRPALGIAGGLILFIIAIRMIFPPPEKKPSTDDHFEEPLIVPLAVPLTAGPSALATVLLLVTQKPGMILTTFIAVAIACVAFAIIMLGSRYLMRLLGNRGLIAVERLMGMLLTTISVQMFLTGIAQYMSSTPSV